MSKILDENAIATTPIVRSGDRVQFNLFEGTFSFLRKNPNERFQWIKYVASNATSDWTYEGDILSVVRSLSKDFGLSYKKIEGPNRSTPIFEFI